MKFLIIPDLHGKVPNIKTKDFDAILAVGDFCSDESKTYMYKVVSEYQKGNDISWYELCGKVAAKKLVKESLKNGRQVLEYLNSFNKPVFFVPGNWDWYEGDDNNGESAWKFLNQKFFKDISKDLKNLKDCHLKKRSFKGFDIIGYGLSSGPEGEDGQFYFTKLAKLFETAKKPIIFISHNSPFNTPIDKINYKKSPRNGEHMGSMVTRQLMDECEPLLCISGHMHEHRRKYKKGKTTCIATGFEKPIELEITNNKVFLKSI